ncbi:hypothetical protein KFU94_37960 [Chloroflexi bacterium TSY]|nr:hypothetical protein [Chloroflexi bacterium TSY]
MDEAFGKDTHLPALMAKPLTATLLKCPKRLVSGPPAPDLSARIIWTRAQSFKLRVRPGEPTPHRCSTR